MNENIILPFLTTNLNRVNKYEQARNFFDPSNSILLITKELSQQITMKQHLHIKELNNKKVDNTKENTDNKDKDSNKEDEIHNKYFNEFYDDEEA